MTGRSQSDMEAEGRTFTLIWAALVGGVALYTGVAAFLTASGMVEPVVEPAIVAVAAFALLAPMLGSFAVRRALIGRVSPSATDEEWLNAYRPAVIVGLALVEGSALGIVTIALLGGQILWVVGGGVAGLALMVLQKPDPTRRNRPL